MDNIISEISDKVTQDLLHRIKEFQPQLEIRDFGEVVQAGDGIALASGLGDIRYQELVVFDNGTRGIAFDLSRDQIGIIIMGDYQEIKPGTRVYALGRIASIPTGESLIGRVVNPLGQPVDGKGPIRAEKYMPIERTAPGILDRQDVDVPLQTGIKAVDSMTPIGRGQRELIIGDRQTGKTAIPIDTIINQRGKDVICIYVAIGQKKSSVARTIDTLERMGGMGHTIIVLSGADEPAAMQYIAPYAGCTIGEFFMDQGRDALVVYDDLTKHAWAYREISLLLRRPPGREAFPGDIFYIHARLLERSAQMATKYIIVPDGHPDNQISEEDAFNGNVYGGPMGLTYAKKALLDLDESHKYKLAKIPTSGGSLTALPIVETQMNDVSAYIPTNIISITDGQIYLEEDLFNSGIRPAINVGISVSRVGGDAQTEAMKQVAARLRLDMASFNELASFAQFGTDLDATTQKMLNHGRHQQELLKQPQYEPLSLAEEIIILFAGDHGYADIIPLEEVLDWEHSLLNFITTSYPEIAKDIEARKSITDETRERLSAAIETFNIPWQG